MFGLGLSEIIFIAVLALIFIGPKQLPEVARTVGRFLNELKRSTSDFTDELKAQARIDRIDLYSAPKKPEAPAAAAPSVTTESEAESASAVTVEKSSEPRQIELFPLTPEKKDV